MSNSKRIFLVFAVLFFAVMIYIGYDISSRTTFPGSKPQLKERIKDKLELKDSTEVDSVKVN
ncbi:hypothetical protein [Fulvivirga lutimaris]|uniref:hypothetical protein n=1 Tax=Fulvivirga lutimaris TaxID=1819566 RepID=UPI0012BC22FF|nr:hypothetical protein [Fulvivirga lutimaris]MTI39503.1 hypothetical protein [Fulvivirga lutimaris]